jgi:hypothetical protein
MVGLKMGERRSIKKIKKRAALHSPVNFAGTKTFGADSHFPGFAATYVDLHALQVDEPPPPRMSIRVAYIVPSCRAASAAFTYLRHFSTSYRT